MGNRDKERDIRREQILQIALDQFIKKGFFGTSTREICRIANISPGLMFHYFDSKIKLYEALIEIGCSEMNFTMENEDSPLKILTQRIQELFQLLKNSPSTAKMFVFMGYASYNAGEISQKAGKMLMQHDIIAQSVPLIQKGQESGEIRSGNPLALSMFFWSSLQGIIETLALKPNSPQPEIDWVLGILRKPK